MNSNDRSPWLVTLRGLGLGLGVIAATSMGFASAQSVRTLRAERYELDAGATARVHFATRNDDAGRDERSAWPASLDWAFVRVAGTQTNHDALVPRDAKDSSVELVLESPGVAMIATDAAPRVETVRGSDLVEFLAARVGPSARPAGWRDAGAADSLVVRRLESSKLFVRVLGAEGFLPRSATAQSKTGQRFELRPLADPTSVRVRGDLPLRVYLPGDALGAKVLARHVASGRTQTFLTDRGGTGFFSVTLSGLWTIEAHHVRRLEPGNGADWEIATATLTFEVPHLDPRETEEAR